MTTEVILALLVSEWKENRCVPLPKMTAPELYHHPGMGCLCGISEFQRLGGLQIKALGGRAL